MIRYGRADDGSVVEISCWDDAQLHELTARRPPQGLSLEAAAPSDPSSVMLRLEVPQAATDADWDRIESDLGLFAAERLAGLVAIHAAVLVVDGRLLILPGRSHTGKSTLAVALRDAGAVLLSDEYALVAPSGGTVAGWSRAARIRVAGGGSRREAVSPQPPLLSLEVGLIAFLSYDPDLRADGALDVSVPSRSETIMALLHETVCGRSRPRESFDAAVAISGFPAVQGRRGEAAGAATELLELLGQELLGHQLLGEESDR